MKDYTDHYVAFLDILGFKTILNRCSCDEIYPLFDTLKEKSKASLSYNFVQIKAFDHIHHMILSDSIVLFVRADIEDAFAALINICSRLQVELANRDEPIFLRGGIVKGGLFYENDIIYGEGLTKAYLLENNHAKYPRIVFTGETLLQGKANSKYMYMELEGSCISYRIDEDYLNYVNYLPNFDTMHSDEKVVAYCLKLLSSCNKWFSSEIDTTTREKYIWLKNNIDKNIKSMPQIEKKIKEIHDEERRCASEKYNLRVHEIYSSDNKPIE